MKDVGNRGKAFDESPDARRAKLRREREGAIARRSVETEKRRNQRRGRAATIASPREQRLKLLQPLLVIVVRGKACGMAELLDLSAAELIVAAGRIPEEWRGVWKDPALFQAMNSMATSPVPAPAPTPKSVQAQARAPVIRQPYKARELSEELL